MRTLFIPLALAASAFSALSARAQTVPDPAGCATASMPLSAESVQDIEGDAQLITFYRIVLRSKPVDGESHFRHMVITSGDTERMAALKSASDALKRRPKDPKTSESWFAAYCPLTAANKK